MTVDEFLVWAEAQPGRHELVNGRVFAMAPERIRHAEIKGAVYVALLDAVRSAGIPCQVLPDGVTVRVDQQTAFEPDVLVRCGSLLDGNAIEILDPLIVVEVLSPSTRKYDAGAKLVGYFLIPSVRHYLMVDPDRRIVVHHQRVDESTIITRLIGFGRIHLDPPGLDVPVEALLGQGGSPLAAS